MNFGHHPSATSSFDVIAQSMAPVSRPHDLDVQQEVQQLLHCNDNLKQKINDLYRTLTVVLAALERANERGATATAAEPDPGRDPMRDPVSTLLTSVESARPGSFKLTSEAANDEQMSGLRRQYADLQAAHDKITAQLQAAQGEIDELKRSNSILDNNVKAATNMVRRERHSHCDQEYQIRRDLLSRFCETASMQMPAMQSFDTSGMCAAFDVAIQDYVKKCDEELSVVVAKNLAGDDVIASQREEINYLRQERRRLESQRSNESVTSPSIYRR